MCGVSLLPLPRPYTHAPQALHRHRSKIACAPRHHNLCAVLFSKHSRTPFRLRRYAAAWAHRTCDGAACMQAGDSVVFSVRPAPPPSGDGNGGGPRHFQVSYEAFVADVREGDFLMVDGGMVIVRVLSIEGPDVMGEVIEPGRVMSRATITLRRGKELVRGHSSMLPVVTAKDWQDIDFAVEHKVRLPPLECPPSYSTLSSHLHEGTARQDATVASHNGAASSGSLEAACAVLALGQCAVLPCVPAVSTLFLQNYLVCRKPRPRPLRNCPAHAPHASCTCGALSLVPLLMRFVLQPHASCVAVLLQQEAWRRSHQAPAFSS